MNKDKRITVAIAAVAVLIIAIVSIGILASIVGTTPFPYTPPPTGNLPGGNLWSQEYQMSSYTWINLVSYTSLCRTQQNVGNICGQDYPGIITPVFQSNINGVYNYSSYVAVITSDPGGYRGNGYPPQGDGICCFGFSVYTPSDYTNQSQVNAAIGLNNQISSKGAFGFQQNTQFSSEVNVTMQTFLRNVNSYILGQFHNSTANLTIHVSPINTGIVITGGGGYLKGTMVTPGILIPAGSSYVFKNWTCTGLGCYAGTNPAPLITIASNTTETANFYVVNVQQSAQNKTTQQNATVTCPSGTTYNSTHNVCLGQTTVINGTTTTTTTSTTGTNNSSKPWYQPFVDFLNWLGSLFK